MEKGSKGEKNKRVYQVIGFMDVSKRIVGKKKWREDGKGVKTKK